jgi:hypothetical protein
MNDSHLYSEPIDLSELKQGNLYFMLNYFDEEVLIPELQTLVFLGREVTGEKNSLLYFQDIESYTTRGPYPNSADRPGDFFDCTDDQLGCIFRLDKAVLELQHCMRRREKMMPKGDRQLSGRTLQKPRFPAAPAHLNIFPRWAPILATHHRDAAVFVERIAGETDQLGKRRANHQSPVS